jgi:hypothetical protein
MDMHVALPTRSFAVCYGSPVPEYASLAGYRRQVFVLLGEFRQAIARPRGRAEALRILKEILPCSHAYFSAVESMLDRISAAGAAPHREDHQRILAELKGALERCSASRGESATADLVHALDSLVMHEAAISLRASEDRSAPR